MSENVEVMDGADWRTPPPCQVSIRLPSADTVTAIAGPKTGLSAGPIPVGLKVGLLDNRSLSKANPSSRIQTLMTCSTVVFTTIGPLGVLPHEYPWPWENRSATS